MQNQSNLKAVQRRQRQATQQKQALTQAREASVRDTRTFFVLEILAIISAVLGLGLSVYVSMVTLDEVRASQTFRRNVEEPLARETLAEFRNSQSYRENFELPLAEKSLEEIEASKRHRQFQSVAQSWTILTTPASGNSGKVEAIEYLYSIGQIFDGIDLSCETMGGTAQARNARTTEKKCDRPTYLTGVQLPKDEYGNARFAQANLSGVSLNFAELPGAFFNFANLDGSILARSNLQGASLGGASLVGTSLVGANLSEANLHSAKLIGAGLREADLSNAKLTRTDFSGADISSANFTGARIRDLKGANFSDTWAWADQPPIGLPAQYGPARYCIRDRDKDFLFKKPDVCNEPK